MWGTNYTNYEALEAIEQVDGNIGNEIEPQAKSENDEIKYINSLMYRQLRSLYKKFECYCAQLPILGFNSAAYDIPLVKSKFAKHLNLQEQSHAFIIKKANKYLCISTDQFNFFGYKSVFSTWLFIFTVFKSI